MKIAYITAGAGGMYCGSCMHDNVLAGALGRLGHEVTLIPTYTPLRTDDVDHSIDEIFYGALNVFLEQKSALFRHTPRFLDRLLNGRRLLAWISKLGGSTDPADLGDLTLSVLQGEDGHQEKELERLVSWLRDEIRPDIVHLTNSMFLGMARRIQQELGVPVVCSVQGEDLFIDGLKEPYRSRVRETLAAKAGDVQAFVAPSRYYADLMKGYLGVPAERMHEAHLGLRFDGFGGVGAELPDRPFVIGYLARMAPEKGLHLLVGAFRRLAERVGREAVRLRVAGYLGERDRAYVDDLKSKLEEWGLGASVDWVGEVDRQGKTEFLHSLHVLSVPTVYHEPKGLFVLESLAHGVPVVQPRHGAFPEVIEATGGGLLVEPDSAEALAAGLEQLMANPSQRAAMGAKGYEVVRRRHDDDAEAVATIALYREVLSEFDAVASSLEITVEETRS